MTNRNWTQEATDKLSELWGAGYTSTEIGKRMGVSRQAVMGKVTRMGFKRSDNATLPDREAALKSDGRAKALYRAVKHEPINDKVIRPSELEASHCRFPFGDPLQPDFGFCGEQVVRWKPYCEAHCKVCFEG